LTALFNVRAQFAQKLTEGFTAQRATVKTATEIWAIGKLGNLKIWQQK